MKKVLALILALSMVLSLAACTSAGKPEETKEAQTTASGEKETAKETEKTPADTAEKTDSADTEGEAPALKEGELYVDPDPANWPTVVVEVCSFSDQLAAEAEIEAALNEYLVSINTGVKCDMLPIAIGDRATRLTLMLADNNDPIDVFGWRWYSSVTNLAKNQQVIPLDKYKDVYPDLWEVYPEAIYRICTVDGQLYSMPSGGCFGQQEVYVMRKDIAEEIGVMDLVDTKITTEQLEEIMAKGKAAHPEMCWQADAALTPYLNVDDLGDAKWLGVLRNRGLGESEIINYYDSDDFYDVCVRFKDWADKGYFRDDPLNNTTAGSELLKQGLCGGFMFEAFDMRYAYTLMQQQVPDYPMVAFQLTDWCGTNSCVYNGWNISAICKNPDAAMKMMYLMYTDEVVLRYFSLGKEGLTYVVTEEGWATYPEGVDSTTVGWNTSAAWFYPNETLSIPFDTSFVEMYDLMKEINHDDSRKYSDAMGFIFDNTAVFDEVTACSSVVDQYRSALTYGQVDVDNYLQDFRDELRDAGIDKVIEEMQRQYDEFLAGK